MVRIKIQIPAGCLALLAAAFVISGCAGSRNSVPSSDCTVPATADSQYLIGAGDTLNIVVWRNEELSASVPVRPDGRISTPLIDDMVAAGKTPSNLARDMEKVLAEYLRSPQVSVIVADQGAANQIQVIGQVVNPQTLSYRNGLRVLDIIVAVGGITEFAAGNRSNLVRQMENGQIECRIRIDDLLKGDLAENVRVFPGDVLVIPETRF
jgi:polysaccharide export outer membrane protein